MKLLHFVLVVSVVGSSEEEQVCHVERRSDLGLAEYRAGAVNLRTDYDTWSADECFQRCCTYKDDFGNHCNAVSYYGVDEEYAVCLLLSCVPLDSCVWMPVTNFTAALVLQDIVEEDAVNQSAAWNQSTVTSQESTISVLTTLPSVSASISPPSGSPDLQDWNEFNDEVPSQDAVPNPDSAAVPGGTLSNNSASNGTLSEGQSTALPGTAQDAWNVVGLDPGNANSTSNNFTDNELIDNRTIPDSLNDWNVVDTSVLSDNEEPTHSLDNGQPQQQQQPAVNPFDESPKDDWNDEIQEGDDDFQSIFGAGDDKFWNDDDDHSQSNQTVAGKEADQNRNDLEQPFNQPEQPFNQPEQSFNQPEQPFNQPEQPFNQPEQPFDQLEQPFNQPEQPFDQPEQPFDQPEQPFNEQEQPQQSFDDVRVTEDNMYDWQMGNNEEETLPNQDETDPVVRTILIPSPGIIIGLSSALGVAVLVFIAVCRKVHKGQEWPKYKPLRSDYDTRYEASSSSSALLP